MEGEGFFTFLGKCRHVNIPTLGCILHRIQAELTDVWVPPFSLNSGDVTSAEHMHNRDVPFLSICYMAGRMLGTENIVVTTTTRSLPLQSQWKTGT